jgi:peptide chain release factor subunit 1
MNSKQKLELKKIIRQLSAIRGRHTELVSVYVPAGYNLDKVINHLQQEQGTAVNIKDARTRKNVIDSLERAIRQLRLYKQTPVNGIAVFAGNSSENESKIKIDVWAVEPPVPINQRIYRCDQTFKIDILESMMQETSVHGLIVMDRREATLGLLKGSRIEVLQKFSSGVPGKFRAGGQSAQRFHRLIEGLAKEFYKRIAEACNQNFLTIKTELKGILVGGPGPTKEDFMHQLNQELKDKVIGVQDLTYTDESGLHDLVDKSKDILAQESVVEEKKVVQDFLEGLGKDADTVAYGKDQVREMISIGAVETLLLSENLDEYEIEGLTDEAEEKGGKVHIISTDTREGQQLKELGGVAAILRYKVNQ